MAVQSGHDRGGQLRFIIDDEDRPCHELTVAITITAALRCVVGRPASRRPLVALAQLMTK